MSSSSESLLEIASPFIMQAQPNDITMHMDASTMLKPLQLKGASSDKNHEVNGLIASGDSRLAIDCTPAINPCAFP